MLLQHLPMTAITTILPVEIIEHILDIVACSDHRTHYFKSGPDIKACALTCQAFRRRSRQHIFRSVKLYHIDRSGQYPGHARVPLASKFAQLITNNTEIREYIRELHYVFQNVQFNDTLSKPIPSALKRLRNLETLALYPESGEFRWKEIHAISRSFLLDVLYLPSLVSLKLKLIRGFNPYDLLPCTNIKKLHIQSVTLSDTIDMPLYQQYIKPIRLRELEIDFSGALTVLDILEDGVIDQKPMLNLKDLEKVTVNYRNFTDISSTEKLLGYTRSLETIHCIVVRFLDDVAPIFSSLSNSLARLKNLSLDVYIDHPKQEVDPLCGIPMGLQTIAGINRLETLSIRIQLSRDTKLTLGREWHTLEEALLGPGFLSLKKFDLSIFSEDSKHRGWLEFMWMLPYIQLSALSSSAFLKFNFHAAAGSRISPSVVDQSMQLSY